MKGHVAGFLSGVIFAIGLAIAGMTQPSKVVAFLDFFGEWDPSLAFVMGGAIAVHFVLFRVILRRKSPLLAEVFEIPRRRDLTPQLIGGAAIFGVGWGLGGFCPGPGLASLATLEPHAMTFVGAMVAGMIAYNWFDQTRSSR